VIIGLSAKPNNIPRLILENLLRWGYRGRKSVEKCGKFGITRMAILSGGFSEFGDEGMKLSDLLLSAARKYDIRFVGPNGIAVANTANGLCLPFPLCHFTGQSEVECSL